MKEKLTYETFLQKILHQEHFSFTRYGDGEWNAIFGKQGANCDGHQYFPLLGTRLANCLKANPQYYLGMQGLGYRQRTNQIEDFIKQNDVLPSAQWTNADILHNASIHGKFNMFIDVINTVENVILVAPEYMKAVNWLMKYDRFIQVPEKNCFNEIHRIHTETVGVIESTRDKNTVVLFVASMPANILVHDLYRHFEQAISLLDIGSVLDPFVGKETRSYHRNMEIKKINNL